MLVIMVWVDWCIENWGFDVVVVVGVVVLCLRRGWVGRVGGSFVLIE